MVHRASLTFESQHAYWGGNYERLSRIKTKCHPNGLFYVHNGVGSEEWGQDWFTKLRKVEPLHSSLDPERGRGAMNLILPPSATLAVNGCPPTQPPLLATNAAVAINLPSGDGSPLRD